PARTLFLGGNNLGSDAGSQAFLARYDSNGSVVWVKTAQGNSALLALGDAQARSVNSDPFGNIYCCGSFSSNVFWGNAYSQTNLHGSGSSPFVAKYTSSGSFLWVTAIPGVATYRYCYAAATDPFGNVVMTTTGDSSILKVSSTGSLLWAIHSTGSVSPSATCTGPDGTIYTTASINSSISLGGSNFTADDTDFLLCKVTSSGTLKWIQQLSGPGSQSANAVVAKPTGEVYLAGSFQATTTFPPFTLTSAADVDIYLAALGIASSPPPPSLSLDLYPGLSIIGTVGLNYRIEYTEASLTNWLPIANLTLPTSPYLWVDAGALGAPKRFYRAVLVTP
ncbi:MAG: hypothetical protein NT154_05705, partial [Verrucomicrobia bacterium]|nr:hypothetical protein [Verrucomicrobiota bacterium]